MVKQIFVNMAVKDLNRSKDFFGKLGFSFNPAFTNETGACLVMSEYIYVMLLTHEFFKTFTNKEVSDAHKNTEMINCIAVESKSAVDNLVDIAMELGATKHKDADDYGWMYSRAFADLDGHQWEVAFIDESKAPKA